jgi:hypothetical protein
MNSFIEKELEQAMKRVEREEQYPDFYNHYTDEHIKELDRAIE